MLIVTSCVLKNAVCLTHVCGVKSIIFEHDNVLIFLYFNVLLDDACLKPKLIKLNKQKQNVSVPTALSSIYVEENKLFLLVLC
jgi:hypothetical protein